MEVLILVEGHIPGMKKHTLDGTNSTFCMIFNQKSSSSRSDFIMINRDSIYIFLSLGFKEKTIHLFNTISINPTFAPRPMDIKCDKILNF